jgi:HKD family nuclease
VSSYLLNVKHIRAAVTLSSSNTLRIEPPLIATKEMCEYMLQSIEESVDFLAKKGSAALFQHLLQKDVKGLPDVQMENSSSQKYVIC